MGSRAAYLIASSLDSDVTDIDHQSMGDGWLALMTDIKDSTTKPLNELGRFTLYQFTSRI